MELSSSRFKSLAVTAGFSFWFFVITNAFDVFSFEVMGIFILVMIVVTQVFTKKLSRALDIFANINTKVFLGALFVFVISIYGVLFRLLKVDLLRLKKQTDTYWLETEESKSNQIRKQY